MDTIAGLNVMHYTRNNVLEYTRSNPNYRRDNKVMELVSGYHYSMWLKNFDNRDYNIGFPITKINKNPDEGDRLPLEILLREQSQIQDSDMDICLCRTDGDEDKLIRCQVTRMVKNDKMANTWEQLKDLLDKKRLVQEDRNMVLIINIEENIKIMKNNLIDYFTDKSYPYGRVLIIGKRSIQQGEFTIIHILTNFLIIDKFESDLAV